jgi:hypothetical protein
MKYKSPVYSEASGKIAGLVYSHNKGGNYVRSLVTPTNPNTTYQQTVRGYVSQLMSLWATVLTPVQRIAWDIYADAVELLDVFGDGRKRSGINHYIRSNVARLNAGMSRVDDAPTHQNLGDYTPPTAGTISAGGGTFGIVFDDTDEWCDEDDAAMLVQLSRPLQPTIQYFKGPYRFAGTIDGDAVAPPTSPGSIVLPFAVAAGQVVAARAVVVRADGRVSAATLFRGTAGV